MRVISLNISETVSSTGTVLKSLSAVLTEGSSNHSLNITNDHPSWDRAMSLVADYQNGELNSDELASKLYETINLTSAVNEKLIKVNDVLDGRMNIVGNRVTIDHEPVDQALEAHILRLLREDGTPKDYRNWTAFAKFVDNLYSNVSVNVRNQLFGWLNYQNLNGQGFTITDDGCLIGYKGCSGSVDNPLSVFSGPAVVDGVPMNGNVPNRPGSVIEINRSLVMDDPSVGCASGLHVGTYNYAKKWARGVLLTVKFNPRDVVSVPTECEAQKVRVCRYEVLEVTEVEYTETTWGDGNYEDEDVDYDFTSGDEISVNEIQEDDFVEIEYRRQNGLVKVYKLRVKNVDSAYVEGELLDSDGYRSFLKSGISLVLRAAIIDSDDDTYDESEGEVCEEDGTYEQPLAPRPSAPDDIDVPIGSVVKIDYVKTSGESKTYEIKVVSVDKVYLSGDLTNGGGRRTFLVDNIECISDVNEEEEESSSTEATSEEKSHSSLTETFYALVDFFTNEILVDKNDETPSDDDYPGSEEEEEIRRHGYRAEGDN